MYSFGIVLWEIIYCQVHLARIMTSKCQVPYCELPEEISEVEFMDYVRKGNRPKVSPFCGDRPMHSVDCVDRVAAQVLPALPTDCSGVLGA